MATGLVWHERYMWHDTGAAAGPLGAGGGWIGHELTPQQEARIGEAEHILQLALAS